MRNADAEIPAALLVYVNELPPEVVNLAINIKAGIDQVMAQYVAENALYPAGKARTELAYRSADTAACQVIQFELRPVGDQFDRIGRYPFISQEIIQVRVDQVDAYRTERR